MQPLNSITDGKKLTVSPSRAKDAVAAMIRRLAHRNANVQLYTLEVSLAAPGPEQQALTLCDLASKCIITKLRS